MDPDDAPAPPPCCLLPCLSLLTGRTNGYPRTPPAPGTPASLSSSSPCCGGSGSPLRPQRASHSLISDGPSDRPRLLQLQQQYTRHYGAACMAHSTLQVRSQRWFQLS